MRTLSGRERFFCFYLLASVYIRHQINAFGGFYYLVLAPPNVFRCFSLVNTWKSVLLPAVRSECFWCLWGACSAKKLLGKDW